MTPLVLLAEDIGPKWLYWPWVEDHTDEIRQRLVEHIELTVLAVLFGLLIALPLALLSVRYRRLYGPVITVTGVLYTIPSLALFAMLGPALGLSYTTAAIGLILYALLAITRNALLYSDVLHLNRDGQNSVTSAIVHFFKTSSTAALYKK